MRFLFVYETGPRARYATCWSSFLSRMFTSSWLEGASSAHDLGIKPSLSNIKAQRQQHAS